MEGGVWVVAGADAAVPPGPSLAKCRSLSPACVPWVIVLQSPAQRELLRDTTAVLCPRVAHLDATAKTCAHEWPLYALVVKAASSKAVPVGYMLTNCESHVPVREFLEALHRSTPTWFAKALAHLVIDVSATEELGIREFLAAHPSLSIAIVWCWFHVTQAWTRWFSSTAADAALRGADGVRHVNALRTLLNNVHASTTAEQEAERVAKVIAYTNEHNLPLCRAYLQKNYFQPADLPKWVRFRWAEAASNQAIEVSRSRTNNPVESHFNALKEILGRLCRRRLDSLVWILVSEVMPHYAVIAAAALTQQKNGTAPPDAAMHKLILQKVVIGRELFLAGKVTATDESNEHGRYVVGSNSCVDQVYDVVLRRVTCTCADTCALLCAHLHAALFNDRLLFERSDAHWALNMVSHRARPELGADAIGTLSRAV